MNIGNKIVFIVFGLVLLFYSVVLTSLEPFRQSPSFLSEVPMVIFLILHFAGFTYWLIYMNSLGNSNWFFTSLISMLIIPIISMTGIHNLSAEQLNGHQQFDFGDFLLTGLLFIAFYFTVRSIFLKENSKFRRLFSSFLSLLNIAFFCFLLITNANYNTEISKLKEETRKISCKSIITKVSLDEPSYKCYSYCIVRKYETREGIYIHSIFTSQQMAAEYSFDIEKGDSLIKTPNSASGTLIKKNGERIEVTFLPG